jgi:isocitrate dehydrogenase (NAD+)
LGAGLSGGIASTAGILHGDGVRVYESIFGAGEETIGKDRANPLPLILPAIEMLRDLEETEAANRILRAVEKVLTERAMLTADLGGTASTRGFTEAIIRAIESA